ncbi:Csa1 family protein [Staphylococcus warneri]|uniref:Csa1 family protein n=1 Tax=Staphylococcus warneri TaxID=1292 RepID=UPI0032601F2C
MVKKWLCIILIPIIAVLLVKAGYYGFKITKENAIKDSLYHILKPYPMKDLSTLYNQSGIRKEKDGGAALEDDDKGAWELKSFTTKRRGENGDTISEGVYMKFNRHTHDANGYYFIDKHSTDIDKYDNGTKETHYPVEYKDHKVKLKKEAKEKGISKSIEKKVDQFKFLSEIANYKNIKDYQNGDITYNYSDNPSYTAEYQLNNHDDNVKAIKNYFDIHTNQAPKVKFEETGNIGANQIGKQIIEYNFVDNDDETITFTDLVSFVPSVEENDNDIE